MTFVDLVIVEHESNVCKMAIDVWGMVHKIGPIIATHGHTKPYFAVLVALTRH